MEGIFIAVEESGAIIDFCVKVRTLVRKDAGKEVGEENRAEKYFTQITFHSLHLRYSSYFCFATKHASLSEQLKLVTEVERTFRDCARDVAFPQAKPSEKEKI
ncbi:hypothetical protein PR048_005410 [Dryococelus australis]|uniref:Uncharacterized protein n=1 Tax=Dryococelus australis TaxID=614101 RepID=A0ABQ9I858_9NEOP|nr:hypothetical protein PR048_005410 [Dryococelus australis]